MLLEIWKEPKIAYKVALVSTRAKRVWRIMTIKLNKALEKSTRTTTQVKMKVKDLKATYK